MSLISILNILTVLITLGILVYTIINRRAIRLVHYNFQNKQLISKKNINDFLLRQKEFYDDYFNEKIKNTKTKVKKENLQKEYKRKTLAIILDRSRFGIFDHSLNTNERIKHILNLKALGNKADRNFLKTIAKNLEEPEEIRKIAQQLIMK
jgi:hypothetical protein